MKEPLGELLVLILCLAIAGYVLINIFVKFTELF